MAPYSQTLSRTPSGQDEKHFPFLCLPAELRNMVYWEVLSKKDYMPTLSQPNLLRTCRQIRDEALAMYYFNNKFLQVLTAWRGPTVSRIHRFIQGKQTTIEMHVRHLKFGIHHKVSDLGPYNEHLQYIFRNLPDGLIFPIGRMGKPVADCADYCVTRKNFAAQLKGKVRLNADFTDVINNGVYDGKLLPPVLELFEAVWLLAHAFPDAEKSIHTFSRLPLGPCFHMW